MIAVVQQAHNSAVTANSVACTIATPTAGNALLAIVLSSGAVTVSSVSGGGVTWVKQVTSTNTAGQEVTLWTGLNSTGIGTTVTATFSGVYATREIWILECSGVVTSGSPTDGTGTNNFVLTGNVQIIPSASVAITPSAGVGVILIAGNQSNVAYSADPAGFTILTGAVLGRVGYQIVAAPSGSYNPAWTKSSNYGNWGSALAAIKAPATASGGSFLPLLGCG